MGLKSTLQRQIHFAQSRAEFQWLERLDRTYFVDSTVRKRSVRARNASRSAFLRGRIHRTFGALSRIDSINSRTYFNGTEKYLATCNGKFTLCERESRAEFQWLERLDRTYCVDSTVRKRSVRARNASRSAFLRGRIHRTFGALSRIDNRHGMDRRRTPTSPATSEADASTSSAAAQSAVDAVAPLESTPATARPIATTHESPAPTNANHPLYTTPSGDAIDCKNTCHSFEPVAAVMTTRPTSRRTDEPPCRPRDDIHAKTCHSVHENARVATTQRAFRPKPHLTIPSGELMDCKNTCQSHDVTSPCPVPRAPPPRHATELKGEIAWCGTNAVHATTDAPYPTIPSGDVMDCKNTCQTLRPAQNRPTRTHHAWKQRDKSSTPEPDGVSDLTLSLDTRSALPNHGASTTRPPVAMAPLITAQLLPAEAATREEPELSVLVVQAESPVTRSHVTCSTTHTTAHTSHDAPSASRPLDAKGRDQSQPSPRARSKTIQISVIAAVLVLIVIVVAVLKPWSNETARGESETGAASTIVPTESRATLVLNFINQHTLTGRRVDYQPGRGDSTRITAEEYALQWLIDSDPWQLLPATSDDTNHTNVRLLQRYALATMWFQQFQTSVWTNVSGWLVDDECLWFGIACQSDDSVTTMALGWNNLVGTLSPDLGLLTRLRAVDVTGNGLTGTLPTTWGGWTSLTSLTLRQTLLEGTLPATWAQWTSLELLDVNGCAFTGRLPDAVALNWSNLRHVDVGYNQLTGSLPLGLFQGWNQLEQFYAWENQFTGTLPRDITTTNVTHVALGYNRLNGTLPTALGRWTRVQEFDVESCQLSGSLPSELGRWTNVTYVSLTYNALTGSLPRLDPWSNVQSVILYGNQLTGPIPDYLGESWTNLSVLNWDDNRFSGTIPSSIGGLTSIISFSVALNELTGTIPSSVGQWTSISAAWWDGNALTGTVPWELCDIVNKSPDELRPSIVVGCGGNVTCSCCECPQ